MVQWVLPGATPAPGPCPRHGRTAALAVLATLAVLPLSAAAQGPAGVAPGIASSAIFAGAPDGALASAFPASATPRPAEVAVSVEGVEGTLRDNVLALLSIHQRAGEEMEEGEIRRLHRRAEREIRDALAPFGHYTPEIRAELTREDEEWRASYHVDPGPPVVLREVDLRLDGEGADDPALQQALAAFPLGEGDPLHHEPYEEGRRRLERVASTRGYFDATFTERDVEADARTGEARIVLHLDTGPRYAFGPVRFQQEDFSEELLEGFIPFDRGDPYDSSTLLEFQNALSGAGLFRTVEVETRTEEAEDGEVPIVVVLTPRPRTRLDVGGGYGTDTGPRGSLGWELRRLNRHGHQMDGELRASFPRREVRSRYIIPFGGEGERVVLTGGFRDDDRPGNRGRSVVLGAAISQDRGGWLETFYLDFHRSWFQVGGVEGITTLVLPGAEWSRVRADDRLYPRRGHRLSLEVRGTDERIGSHVTFGQVTLRGRVVRPVGESGRFLSRATLGLTEVDDFGRLPGLFRYFAGGDRSVRGYGFQRLGDRDEEGRVRGGRHLVVGSVEYEHLVGEIAGGPWGGAAFYDVGNALNSFRDGLEQGIGVGARWLSPIGMIRFDVATAALSRSGWPVRIHLTVGGDL